MLFTHPNIIVKESPIHGLGVFAISDIPKDTLIEECHYIVLKNRFRQLDKVLQKYVFSYPKRKSQSAIGFGFASIYNHSEEPNIEFEYDNDKLIFTSLRDIKKGEELCHCYSSSFVKKTITNN